MRQCLTFGTEGAHVAARAGQRSPILILDEPTAALDTIAESQVVEVLQRLRQGRTTFVVAHRLSTVRDADRIMVMQNGRIVDEGEPLRTSFLYRQLSEPEEAALTA